MPDANSSSDDMLNLIVQQLMQPKGTSNALTDVGGILGGAAAGNAAGVDAQNRTALAGGALGNNLFQSSMQRALAQAALPNFRAQQAVTGDQIANTQDVVPTGPANVMAHVVNFTGGRRPSNLGPNARSAGAALSNLGASNLGKDVLPEVPTMPKMATGGVLGNLLGGGALGTSLLGALMKGSGGSGGGGDIGKLFGDIKNLFGHGGDSTSLYLDPTFHDPSNPDASGGVDPSLATGYDPMAAYEEWLKQQQGGGTPDDIPNDNGPSDSWDHP